MKSRRFPDLVEGYGCALRLVCQSRQFRRSFNTVAPLFQIADHERKVGLFDQPCPNEVGQPLLAKLELVRLERSPE